MNPAENFADKWEIYPERRDAFFSWMDRLNDDLGKASLLTSADQLGQLLQESFGRISVSKVLRKNYPTHRRQPSGIIESLRKVVEAVLHRDQPLEPPPWQIVHGGNAHIRGWVVRNVRRHEIQSGDTVEKERKLKFRIETDVPKPFRVYWQAVNTGEEAERARDLRGEFNEGEASEGGVVRTETTKYTGKHWVQCFVVKDGVCVARSGEFFVLIS